MLGGGSVGVEVPTTAADYRQYTVLTQTSVERSPIELQVGDSVKKDP